MFPQISASEFYLTGILQSALQSFAVCLTGRLAWIASEDSSSQVSISTDMQKILTN